MSFVGLCKGKIAFFIAPLIFSAFIACFPASAAATGSGKLIKLQLLKDEQVADSCRVSFLAKNTMGTSIEDLSLDLVIFDREGGLVDLLSVSLGRLPNKKTRVQAYDIAGVKCEGIASLLVNDVTACTGEALNNAACLDAMDISHRGQIELQL
ncbi:hypothetical protein [Polycladidibacter hongkongensis]|uniref:hypothetical protein n=1 Tax=Polycladidibacter hongkongensis TaxID=1647556 RepID=UPI000830C048|nr:hypothetical protein [Pseudovibrio hongkongensis]